MIRLNLQALNPFRRTSEPASTRKQSEPPKPEPPKPESKNWWDRSKDFFADTWESTKKTVDETKDAGLKKGREKFEETLWGEYKGDWGRHGDRYENPADANSQRETTATINARIARRSEAEGAALGKLSPIDQVRYRKLQELTQSDPLAKEALQTMLIDGRLPGNKDLQGHATLLANLSTLAEQSVAPHVNHADLVSNLIQEVENPVCINQKDKSTCVATSSTIDLALTNPSEYVRLVAGLAAPAGQVKMAGGAVLKREPNWHETLDDRTQSAHMISGALMELGNGILAYDGAKDKTKAFNVELYEGLWHMEANRILENLHGRNYNADFVTRWNLEKTMKQVEESTAEGKRVPAGLAWGDSGHQIVIEGIKDGQVYYLNPHGNRERMPEAEFKARLRSVHFY